MLRTALLGGNSITLDADMSKYIETLSEQGVIDGLEVSSGSVAPGKAWVKATRSNGETIMVLVQNAEVLAVDTTGTKKIWIEIKQEAIDNGALNNEDGTGIASIKTGPSVPSQNSLLLASVAENVVKDERNLIPKIQSVAQRTTSLEQKMETQEQKVEKLEEAGTPSYLGITAIVGEKYTMEDTLFLQKTPSFADSTIAINVGDSAENKEQHIQRIASGTASNQLKLKMKKFGAPTTSVVVEVRKGVKVDVSNKEAYRYGGEVVASTTIAYTQFTTEWKEFTLTLNNQFGATKGELLDIVVYQQGGIVNEANYYQVACDSTQYSEAFSVVAVNGSSRVRNKLMPYCVSEGFVEELLAKASFDKILEENKSFGHSAPFRTYTINSRQFTPILHIEFTTQDKWAYFYLNNNFYRLGVDGGGHFYLYLDFLQPGTFNLKYQSHDGLLYVKKSKIEYRKKRKIAEVYPRYMSGIGETLQTTMRGKHIDDSIIGHIDTDVRHLDATTGNVVLGNALGYFSIRGFDGKIYKIPVYGG